MAGERSLRRRVRTTAILMILIGDSDDGTVMNSSGHCIIPMRIWVIIPDLPATLITLRAALAGIDGDRGR
jgi:hypothetical protein